LEKPSCSNAEEAKALFNHPLLKAPNAPVLLEAFHYRFHPAWQTFLSLVHDNTAAGPVKHAFAQQYLPKGIFSADDIRWRYDLSGGALMDFGTYPLNCLRQILREEPREVLQAQERVDLPAKSDKAEDQPVEQAMTATYKTESGATARLVADLATSSSWMRSLPGFGWPKCEAELEEKDLGTSDGETHSVKRKVTIWNHLFPSIYHRIDVDDTHSIRRDGRIVKTWNESQYLKAYSWSPEDGRGVTGQDWWTTYLYQLNEFVNKVKGRDGSGVWVDGEDSIKQMEAIDRTYEKAGMKVRPTSAFEL
jgi:predicted dehydrogenase